MVHVLPFKGKEEPKVRPFNGPYKNEETPADVYEQSTASKVGSFIKNKVNTSVANAKAERAANIEVKKKRQEQYNAGYEKGIYQKGLNEGAGRSSGGRTGSYKMSGGRSVSGNDMFAGGFLGGGIGFNMFGDQPAPRAPPPMKTTVISKSGKITVQEPVMPQHKKQENTDPFGGNFWGGNPGASSGKKGEKHPYDIF